MKRVVEGDHILFAVRRKGDGNLRGGNLIVAGNIHGRFRYLCAKGLVFHPLGLVQLLVGVLLQIAHRIAGKAVCCLEGDGAGEGVGAVSVFHNGGAINLFFQIGYIIGFGVGSVSVPARILAIQIPAVDIVAAIVQHPVGIDCAQNRSTVGGAQQIQVIACSACVVVIHIASGQLRSGGAVSKKAAAVACGGVAVDQAFFHGQRGIGEHIHTAAVCGRVAANLTVIAQRSRAVIPQEQAACRGCGILGDGGVVGRDRCACVGEDAAAPAGGLVAIDGRILKLCLNGGIPGVQQVHAAAVGGAVVKNVSVRQCKVRNVRKFSNGPRCGEDAAAVGCRIVGNRDLAILRAVRTKENFTPQVDTAAEANCGVVLNGGAIFQGERTLTVLVALQEHAAAEAIRIAGFVAFHRNIVQCDGA